MCSLDVEKLICPRGAFLESLRIAHTSPNVGVFLTCEEHMHEALVIAHHVAKLVLCTTYEGTLQ